MLYNAKNFEIVKILDKSIYSRKEIYGIFIAPNETVATDSFKLIKITSVLGENSGLNNMKPAIITPDEVVNIVRTLNLKKSEKDKRLDTITIVKRTENTITFHRENYPEITVNTVDEKYPKYQQIIPNNPAKIEVKLNAKYIIDLLNIMKDFDKNATVNLKFYGDKKPLVIEANNEMQVATALLMPVIS